MNKFNWAPVLSQLILGLTLRTQPAVAQNVLRDDPLPLEANGIVVPVNKTVTPPGGDTSGARGRPETLQGALKDLGATVTGKQIKMSLAADVLFDFDRAELRPKAAPTLEKVAAVLKSYPQATARIEGHTDGKGNEPYNQKLSERRASSVRNWLALHGVSTAMTTRGWGKIKPVTPNAKPDGSDDPDGRQKNRRVEITVKTG